MLVVKNPPASAGDVRDVGSIPGLGRSSEGGHGNPFQCSCLEKPMDRGALAGCSPQGCTELDTTSDLARTYHKNLQFYVHIWMMWFFFLASLPWRRQWHPTPVLLPGKSHGWRSLVSCSPWGLEELDTTERLHVHFYELEKEMATHSSVLAWRIPGTGEPGGPPSMRLHRVGHDWSDLAAAAKLCNHHNHPVLKHFHHPNEILHTLLELLDITTPRLWQPLTYLLLP